MTKEAGLLSDLGPLYHTYDWFGVQNEQHPGIYKLNQKAKQAIIGGYILQAIAKCRKTLDTKVSFAELFCADGYYAMLARHFGADDSTGIDNDRDGQLASAERIAARLGIDQCKFIKMDVNEADKLGQFDVVANLGGLYHVSNPEEILQKSYEMARHFLIVQTVVSLANNQKSYFESPAPGWDWGSRYNPRSFYRMLMSKGWNIVDYHFNELEGNGRPEDRGSVYCLISKEAPNGLTLLTSAFRRISVKML
ncbi:MULTISPECIES: class I SAM-dependent methyltransferase [Agrobacterium tumefaciens complex]|uniref:class I SAM-dependent methyltransferase n=1 Tax=Agrobacterium tumefaciens TaxID=358 RepID=UPI0015733BCA|nr:methyltransferase domain-containing protein [Agrobacterium tumefaciens]NTA51251.1 methyltransferase domain-containing protein [Agrobacterium tumefaciens]